MPAQIEPLGEGSARIWWIVPQLAAGESRQYTIQIGKQGVEPVFTWTDTAGESMDLRLGDREVLRYMYTPFDPNDIEMTKKPFHHVFDPDGSRLITKGAGGRYPHHRGIFLGYKKCEFDGKSVDTWHAKKGEHEVHRKVSESITGPVMGGHTVLIDWNDREGKTFLKETRSLRAFRQSAGHVLIEFESTLRATHGPVKLDGDPQHSGAQFRAAQEVNERQKETRYLRPAQWAHLPADQQINTPEHKDLPWNAIQFRLGDRSYTVAYLTDPKHPDDALFSERLYGRFGEFFPWNLTKENPLSVHYRWWITAGKEVTREQVEQRYQDMVQPPKVTIMN